MLGPGDSWGADGPLPTTTVIAASDRAVAEAVDAGADVVAVSGGDLCRTLGGRGDVATRLGGTALLLPVDVATVVLDENVALTTVAHVIARTRAWNGPAAAVMNAEWLGEWDVAPRAHPGDGRLDIVQGALPWRDRWQARARVRTGDHLPHPGLRVSRASEAHIRFDRPRAVWVDGQRAGRASTIDVSITATVLVAV